MKKTPIAILMTLGLVAAACGGSDDTAEPSAPVTDAAEVVDDEPADTAMEEEAPADTAMEEEPAEEAVEPAEEPAEPAGDLADIKVAYLPVTGVISLFTGIDQGFYEAEGLAIEPIETPGASLIPGLASGEFDIVYTGVPPTILSRGNGLPVVALVPAADIQDTTEDCVIKVMVPPESDIASPADLAGATVAVDSLFQLPHLALIQSLTSQGIVMDEVDVIEIPFPTQIEGALGGQSDAITATEPFVTIAEKQGFTTVTSICEGFSSPNNAALYITTDSWADENPDLAAAFTAATMESSEFANGDPDYVRGLIPTFTRVSEELAGEILLPTAGTTFNRDIFDTYVAVLQDNDILDGDVDLDAILRLT